MAELKPDERPEAHHAPIKSSIEKPVEDDAPGSASAAASGAASAASGSSRPADVKLWRSDDVAEWMAEVDDSDGTVML